MYSTYETNAKVSLNLCRFCGTRGYNKLNSPIDKRFSYIAGTLIMLNICTECQTFIESICKFCDQVKKVSQMLLEIDNTFEENAAINLNSKSISVGDKHESDLDNLPKITGKITSEIEIVNNPYQEASSDCENSRENGHQEMIEIVKEEVFEEMEDDFDLKESQVQVCKTVETRFDTALFCSNTKSADEYQHNKETNIKRNKKTKLKQCEICNNKILLLNSADLLQHRKTHWSIVEEEHSFFKCPYCDYKQLQREKILQHMHKCHCRGKNVCEICNKHFLHKKYLNRHKKTHENAEAACPFCQKVFKGSRIKNHIKNHKEQCLTCTICGDLLKGRKTLKHHMLVHSDVKAYKCTYCDKDFKTTFALQGHMIVHTGLKLFPCRFCESSFGHLSNRRRHEQTLHAKKYKRMTDDKTYSNEVKLPSVEQLYKMLEDLKNGREINYSKEKEKYDASFIINK